MSQGRGDRDGGARSEWFELPDEAMAEVEAMIAGNGVAVPAGQTEGGVT